MAHEAAATLNPLFLELEWLAAAARGARIAIELVLAGPRAWLRPERRARARS